jgi:hypothetical protein
MQYFPEKQNSTFFKTDTNHSFIQRYIIWVTEKAFWTSTNAKIMYLSKL